MPKNRPTHPKSTLTSEDAPSFRPIVRVARRLVINFRAGRPIHNEIGALEKLFQGVADSFKHDALKSSEGAK